MERPDATNPSDPMATVLAEVHRARAVDERPPVVVGVSGPISGGKSTFAARLAGELASAGLRAPVVSADGFLFPNAELLDRGIFDRKGFPESYDVASIATFVDAVESGSTDVIPPTYSHEAYDVVAGEHPIGPVDVLVLEGIIVLQEPTVDRIDLGIYLAADPDDLRDWYEVRLGQVVDELPDDSTSILTMFRGLDPVAFRAAAMGVWDSVNEPNNRLHVVPSGERAQIVLTQDASHRLVDVQVRAGA